MGYGPGTTSLYQSHPWVLAVLPTGETLGVLADTTQKKEGTIRIISPASYPIITFRPFSSPTAVLQTLSHAVYGMLMARSTTYEGMELADKNKRSFVLTRAGFIGSQRYAATWTGDNLSNWEHLHMSISMVLQLGLSGQPLSGPDIGGFAGNATPRLFARWMGVGAMFPFCRGHSEAGTDDHEPWSFGEECEEVYCAALKRRYQLLHIFTPYFTLPIQLVLQLQLQSFSLIRKIPS